MKSAIVLLFGLTSFLAAALLFSAEPMIGKMILPRFGGTPAVWNTCLVFFQLMLLLGYSLSSDLVGARGVEPHRVSGWFVTGLALLLAPGFAAQPIRLGLGGEGAPPANETPAWQVLQVLWGGAALPLVLVSATAPLVQRWFVATGHRHADDPYFLYAASNAGSLTALLAYPLAIEPNLRLSVQSQVWKAGFLALALLILTCGVVARGLGRSRLKRTEGRVESSGRNRLGAESESESGLRTPPTRGTWLRWLSVVFIPSCWLMGVTTYLTTDLAAIPLLWVIPLALYLSSFILAFARSTSGFVRLASRALPWLVFPLVLIMIAGFVQAIWIPLHVLAFFVGAVACHGALAQARPSARDLSTFYLIIALGGLLGGLFNTMIAPLVFDRIIEYPLAIVLACLIAPGPEGRSGRRAGQQWLGDLLLPAAVFLLTALLITNQAGLADSLLGVLGLMIASGLGVLALMTARQRPIRFGLAAGSALLAGGLTQGPSGRLIHIERNFYGIVRVTEDSKGSVHRLFHGNTLHGQQNLEPARRREPSTYFTRSGPIGQVFEALGSKLDRPGVRVAVVGLGPGTLASYARPGQDWTFFELDPAIERIARDPRYFTYLRDCLAESFDVVVGDARLRLREAPDHAYQIIVLDAFSSDSLPVHLVTREAIALYRSKLEADGVLAFNLSNRYLDLDPVLGRQVADAGWVCRLRYDTWLTPEERQAGKQPSIWGVAAPTELDLGGLVSDPRWHRPALRPGSRVWTDEFSDLASYFLWGPRGLGRRMADPDTRPGSSQSHIHVP